jgi:hypothetical protein
VTMCLRLATRPATTRLFPQVWCGEVGYPQGTPPKQRGLRAGRPTNGA